MKWPLHSEMLLHATASRMLAVRADAISDSGDSCVEVLMLGTSKGANEVAKPVQPTTIRENHSIRNLR